MKYFIGLQSNRVDIYRPKQLGLGYSIHRNVFPPFKNNIHMYCNFILQLPTAISIATAISKSPILASKTAQFPGELFSSRDKWKKLAQQEQDSLQN